MVRLTCVSHQNRWVDPFLRNLTGDRLHRIEERFAGVNGGGRVPSTLRSFASLDLPHASVEELFEKYPAGMTKLVPVSARPTSLRLLSVLVKTPFRLFPSSMPRSKFGPRRLRTPPRGSLTTTTMAMIPRSLWSITLLLLLPLPPLSSSLSKPNAVSYSIPLPKSLIQVFGWTTSPVLTLAGCGLFSQYHRSQVIIC